MKTLAITLIATVLMANTGCNEQATPGDESAYQAELKRYSQQNEEYWAEYGKQEAVETARREKAWGETEEMLRKDKELQARWESILVKHEEQAERFDRILDKWESIVPSAKE